MKTCKQAGRLLRGQTGLTLVELVVVMVIVAILSVFLSSIISYEADAYDKLTNQTEGLQVARRALQLITRDFRHMMSADSIFSAADDSIKFDLLNDVFVSYKHVDSRILRNDDLLLDAVQSIQFVYYDTLGTALSTPVSNPSTINSIGISLTRNMNGHAFNLQAKVQPRNF